MAPADKWDENNKLRLLLAVIDTGEVSGKWEIVAQKVGRGISLEGCR
jgi:hypothetical protein